MPPTNKKHLRPRVLRTDGSIIPCEPANKRDFTLAEIKLLIRKDEKDNPMIEVVPIYRTGELFICDEDGIEKNLDTNPTATLEFCNDVIQGEKGVVGNVLICPNSMLK